MKKLSSCVVLFAKDYRTVRSRLTQKKGARLTQEKGARLTQSLRSADGRKLVHKRKRMELKLFLPGSPGGSKKKKKKKKDEVEVAKGAPYFRR